ncbi:amino acid ABC transporter permease [Vibrio hangzhouensis]|uniref:Polar amino acid transport system permease protein n=1 Tax=Vibrio hangzhouensis TaxID=462991 RepID=A0A1H5RQS0_9VIBR|nr:amino acid ABC transporter permease [Vibrio hangzhouensis]SEF40693.1 polar amino acid transport system permease protein [Vibrio hangzhouensis]
MDFSLYVNYAPLLTKGLVYTLYVCSMSLLISVSGGLLIYGLSRIKLIVAKVFYAAYLTLFRGTPLLVQVYLLFYGGPFIGIELSAEQVGIIGLGLYGSAYFAEIYRSGFANIPKGQLESAFDLGFSKLQILIRVQLPQMLGLIIPPGINQSIILVKESAILSIITVPEITKAAISMATQTFTVVEPYLFLAVAYWIITFALSRVGRWSESYATRYLARS